MTQPRLLVNAAWPAGRGPEPTALVAQATTAGADGIGLPDGPRLFPDPFLGAERLLAGTDVALAGPCVLGLGLRHPATVGVGLRTLVDSHGGRVFGVVARGESAVRNEGLAVPSLRSYLADLDTVLDVLGPARDRCTLLGAASGPRTIAGTVARLGGVLLDVGVDPEVVAAAVASARRADPDTRCWLFVRAVIAHSADEARTCTATLLGSCATRLAASPDWYRVPNSARESVAQIAAAHDYRTHGTAGSDATESGAHALVRDRFFITGDDQTIETRLGALAAVGIDGVVLAGATGGLLERLSGTLAALRAGLSEASGSGPADGIGPSERKAVR